MNSTQLASFVPSAGARQAPWSDIVLDEIDYGIIVLTPQLRLAHANRIARKELMGASPLHLLNGELHATSRSDDRQLQDALQLASNRGLRRLLAFNRGEHTVTMAVIPLARVDDVQAQPSAAPVLAILGRRQVCETLSTQALSTCLGLTQAEGTVLAQLVAQQCPTEIAARLSVAVCTIRTHIANIRAKTGVSSIRELVQLMARLPPLTSRLLQ